LVQQWKVSITPRVIEQTVAIIKAYHYYQKYTKFLSNIFLLWLTPHVGKCTWDDQHRFKCKRSSTDHIFYTCQILKTSQNLHL